MQEKTIITISRQYGSGGKEIAELLAEKLGVRCYDRQILYLAAEKWETQMWILSPFWNLLIRRLTAVSGA